MLWNIFCAIIIARSTNLLALKNLNSSLTFAMYIIQIVYYGSTHTRNRSDTSFEKLK